MDVESDTNTTSRAREAFDKNAEDIRRLLSLHEEQGGISPGRRYGLEVLNKSAIVLMVAFWEAYCEDITAEAVDSIVKNSNNSSCLPTSLKKIVSKEVKNDVNEVSPWALADNNWRNFISVRLSKITKERNRKLNTPKTGSINSLFKESVGIENISSCWKWQNMKKETAERKLDRLIELRGSIAHRGVHSESVKKATVDGYFNFIDNLIGVTGREVNNYVHEITGKYLF